MRWFTKVPTWPTCSPEGVPLRLQNAIYDLLSAWSAPPRGRLRYVDRETGDWAMFDRFEIEPDHDDPDGFSRALCCFVASAAIHHASETGCETFQVEIQPEDGKGYVSRSFCVAIPPPSDWEEAAAEHRARQQPTPQFDD